MVAVVDLVPEDPLFVPPLEFAPLPLVLLRGEEEGAVWLALVEVFGELFAPFAIKKDWFKINRLNKIQNGDNFSITLRQLVVVPLPVTDFVLFSRAEVSTSELTGEFIITSNLVIFLLPLIFLAPNLE